MANKYTYTQQAITQTWKMATEIMKLWYFSPQEWTLEDYTKVNSAAEEEKAYDKVENKTAK